MNVILFRYTVSTEEIDKFHEEFPNFQVYFEGDSPEEKLSEKQWGKVAIIYGKSLSSHELSMAHQLRWVHSPSPYLDLLCFKEIQERGNIIITNTKEENISQICEFIVGVIYYFAKQIFYWNKKEGKTLSRSEVCSKILHLKGLTFLQVGLGYIGSAVAKWAYTMGMNVLGVEDRETFHPFCNKTFSKKQLHSILPTADIVSIALPRGLQHDQWFKDLDLELLKEGAILSIRGGGDFFDVAALSEVVDSKKMRGVLLDLDKPSLDLENSLLGKKDNVLITPNIGHYPKVLEGKSFKIFRRNLRNLLHGNLTEMINHVNKEEY